MRSEPGYGDKSRQPASILAWLIGANIAVFIVQILFVYALGNYGFQNFFALSPDALKHFFIWTPFTYAFLHSIDGIWHIIINMLCLFFLWRMLKPELGEQRLLQLYVMGLFAGAAMFLSVNFLGHTSVIGASAAVMALLACFCVLFPERHITLLLFFVIPISIKPKYLLWFSLATTGLSFLMFELAPLIGGRAGGASAVSHSAHLGGLLMGIYYARALATRGPISVPTTRVKKPAWATRKKPSESGSFSVNILGRHKLRSEVDRILDKINKEGFGSLTEDEKAILDRAKDVMKR